ncbi:hypothetical protein ACIOJ9_34450 [Streptomyces sp. NPDC088175]|uniref:hypothetical protein n=1 Tax=unclassified Streptomyces TaxID=2593676 RepID=UPI0038287082
MNEDRTRAAVALLAAVVAGLIAVSRPGMIPALTLAVAVWMALSVYLKRNAQPWRSWPRTARTPS